MLMPGAAAHVYESVRRRSSDPVRHRLRRARLLPSWLALVMRVVVVGGLAFGGGFLGIIAARTLGWVLAANGDLALASAALVLV